MPVCNKLFDLNDFSNCDSTQCFAATTARPMRLQCYAWTVSRTATTKAIDSPNSLAEVETATVATLTQ